MGRFVCCHEQRGWEWCVHMVAMVVVMTALSISILGALAFGVWWLGKKIEKEADVLHVVVESQTQQLSMASSELHFARLEVGRTREEVGFVREELGALRGEVDMYAHGPPSLRGLEIQGEPSGVREIRP